jgi:hypothetical protein
MYANYDLNEKLLGKKKDSKAQSRTSALELNNLERVSIDLGVPDDAKKVETKKVYTDPGNFLFDVCTCACCYEEYA